jgi:hypothetical protein
MRGNLKFGQMHRYVGWGLYPTNSANDQRQATNFPALPPKFLVALTATSA